MKVLMAPVNIAGQPLTLVNELKKQGIDISLYQYILGKEHRFGYDQGTTFDLKDKDRRIAEIDVLKKAFEDKFDIFHFWMTTFFSIPKYEAFYGFDLPYIKVRGKKIIYRSTGYDVRTKKRDLEINPYSPFRYGFTLNVDERKQNRYLDYLKDYVDQFISQDPEMAGYLPNAKIIPRSIDLSLWPFTGVSTSDRPLVIHAPSKEIVKGSKFILKAVDELQSEGLKFDFKLITDLKQEQAKELYKKADICIDQILIGWYGVFAIECMALGKPVIVYLREDLLNDGISKNIPVVNANPDNIKSSLKQLIKDKEHRFALSKSARNYVKNVHDVSVVAKKLKDIYNIVYEGPVKCPSTNFDLKYFSLNFQEYKNIISELHNKLKKNNDKTKYLLNKVKFIEGQFEKLRAAYEEETKKKLYYKNKLLSKIKK